MPRSQTWALILVCGKIAGAQKIKIGCENILDLRKISKQTIETKKINPKENKHKTQRFTWFSNSLHPWMTRTNFIITNLE